MEAISIIDGLPSDPDEAIAVEYMWRHLDEKIAILEKEWRRGAPAPELHANLELRYGKLPEMQKEPRQKPMETVKLAIARGRKTAFDGMSAYVLPWTSERETDAIKWFTNHLPTIWPREIHFLAEDLATLYVACMAMEVATVRAKPVADDPFPAPPVLITGPTGTGKELLATAIHLRSGREPPPWNVRDLQQFGALNCGGLPTALLESELFGHVKGAFTGAFDNKTGFVRQFEKGTLFLDEIGDMPAEVQVRLLRFLNNGEFRRVGSNKIERATPRIIAATHVNLEEQVQEKEFREDLYYRVRGRRLRLRGLAERSSASRQMLIQRFLAEESRCRSLPEARLTRRAKTALQNYDWPGNMRELRYVVERLVDQASPTRVLDIGELNPEIAYHYRHCAPPHMQDVLAAMAEKERGDARRAVFVMVQRLDSRFQEQAQKTDTRAATLARTANLMARLTRNLGVGSKLDLQVKALNLATMAMLLAEFRATWLEKSAQGLPEDAAEVKEAIRFWEARIAKEEAVAKDNQAALQEDVDRASSAFAVSNIAAILMRTAENGNAPIVAKLLQFLEAAAEMTEVTPIGNGIRALIEPFVELTPDQFVETFKGLLVESTPVEQETLTWGDIKDDPAKIDEVVQSFGGTAAKAAKAMGVAPETLYRARGKRKRVNGEETNGKSKGRRKESP